LDAEKARQRAPKPSWREDPSLVENQTFWNRADSYIVYMGKI